MRPRSVPDGPLVRWLLDPAGASRRLASGVDEFAEAAGPWALAAIAALAASAAIVVLVRYLAHRRWWRHGRVVRVLTPPEVDASGGEALWRNLHDLIRPRWLRLVAGQPHIAFEYACTETGLSIGLWVPGVVPPGMVERAVESAWPAARTDTTPAADAPPLLPDEWHVRGGRLRLTQPAWFSLRTTHETDPLRALLAAGEAGPGEATVVQIAARPATARARARLRRAAGHLRSSRVPSPFSIVAPTPGRGRSLDPSVAPDVRDVLTKTSSPLWEVDVRYAVAASEPNRKVLRGRASAVAAAFALQAARNQLARRRLPRPAGVIAGRSFGRGDLLSTLELAALAHLPTDRIVPGLARAGARPVPPPPAVASDKREGRVLGDSDAGRRRPVVLRVADGRHHVHLMGKTGAGKTALIANLVLDDYTAGRGAVVIDPRGDLIGDIEARLGRRPPRVVLLDPLRPDSRPTLNVLERSPEGLGNDVVVDHLVGILSRVYERSWGPRLEDVLRSACLTLLEQDGATLADVPRILERPGVWRDYLPDRPADDTLRGFWEGFEALSAATRAERTGPLLYKLRGFLLRPAIAEIVGARTSSLDLRRILDHGGLLLVRVPKGLLGEDTARLLGSFVVTKAWQAAMARAGVPEDERPDASVYVDEFQNFVSLPRSFEDVLAESRGYHVSWLLAHQNLAQLPRELRDGVSANARSKVWFTSSPEDAFVLARHTHPHLTEHDLANLGQHQAAVRLVVDRTDQPAFTMRTRPLPPIGRAA